MPQRMALKATAGPEGVPPEQANQTAQTLTCRFAPSAGLEPATYGWHLHPPHRVRDLDDAADPGRSQSLSRRAGHERAVAPVPCPRDQRVSGGCPMARLLAALRWCCLAAWPQVRRSGWTLDSGAAWPDRVAVEGRPIGLRSLARPSLVRQVCGSERGRVRGRTSTGIAREHAQADSTISPLPTPLLGPPHSARPHNSG